MSITLPSRRYTYVTITNCFDTSIKVTYVIFTKNL
jgi:hypothetical protein